MEYTKAQAIANLLTKYKDEYKSKFKILEMISPCELSNFHALADGKLCEGVFRVEASTKEILWILLIDWRKSGDYYVTLFSDSKSRLIAEIHKCIVEGEEKTLNWKYSPRKQDRKNDERRAYFVEAFLSEEVFISVPNNLEQVADFLSELFFLAESRIKADNLDSDKPICRDGFPEGKLKERLHLERERNSSLVHLVKQDTLQNKGCLSCSCCGFDFHAKYGDIGKGYIEAHHIKPVSTLNESGEVTEKKDLVLVCSNCHRMLHRHRPWLELSDLTKLLNNR